MMELAGLSFLGLGVQPPMAEWGSMINDGRSMLQISPWMVLAPGLAIFITVMLFNLLGDTLRDFMDPKERAKEITKQMNIKKERKTIMKKKLIAAILTGANAGSRTDQQVYGLTEKRHSYTERQDTVKKWVMRD